MTKSWLGIVSFSLAAMTMTTGLGCTTGGESSTPTTTPGPDPTEERAAPETPVSEDSRTPNGRSELVRALEERDPSEISVTEAGTDSAVVLAVPEPTTELSQRLARFGDLYLGFDYRADPSVRLDGLAGMVNPTLLGELSTPLPPALAETLVSEERTVVAALDSITGTETLPNGDRAYRLRFDLTESDAFTEGEERVHTIIVIVDSNDMIEEIR